MDFMVRGEMVVDVTPDHVQSTSPKSKIRVVGPENWSERSSGDGVCEDGMMSERRERERGSMCKGARRGALACSERVLSASKKEGKSRTLYLSGHWFSVRYARSQIFDPRTLA